MDNMFNFSSDNTCTECGKTSEMGMCEGCQTGSMYNYTALQNEEEPIEHISVEIFEECPIEYINVEISIKENEKEPIDYINDSYNQAGER